MQNGRSPAQPNGRGGYESRRGHRQEEGRATIDLCPTPQQGDPLLLQGMEIPHTQKIATTRPGHNQSRQARLPPLRLQGTLEAGSWEAGRFPSEQSFPSELPTSCPETKRTHKGRMVIKVTQRSHLHTSAPRPQKKCPTFLLHNRGRPSLQSKGDVPRGAWRAAKQPATSEENKHHSAPQGTSLVRYLCQGGQVFQHVTKLGKGAGF